MKNLCSLGSVEAGRVARNPFCQTSGRLGRHYTWSRDRRSRPDRGGFFKSLRLRRL